MALRNPKENITLEQVIPLVEKLSQGDQVKLWRKLDAEEWIREWNLLSEEIENRCAAKGLPPLTDAEITAEFKAYRNDEDARAQGSC